MENPIYTFATPTVVSSLSLLSVRRMLGTRS